MDSRRGLRAYLALAFGIAWTGVLLMAARTGLPAPLDAPPGNRLLVSAAMLARPSLAGLAVLVIREQAPRRRGSLAQAHGSP